MAEIFLHINDAQHGPYTAEQLEVWLRDGTVAPISVSGPAAPNRKSRRHMAEPSGGATPEAEDSTAGSKT